MHENTTVLRQLQREHSERFSWNKDKFGEYAAREEMETRRIVIENLAAAPVFLSSDAMIARATMARDVRKQQREIKNGRKNLILDSMDNFGGGDCPLSDSESEGPTTLKPAKVTMSRTPYRWKISQCRPVDGEIIPSDQAYSDIILDEGMSVPASSTWSRFVDVESLCDKRTEKNTLVYITEHRVKYNGEPIWRLKTEHKCCSSGHWGQSSACTLLKDKDIVRVKIMHKGRKNLGQGWNSNEVREYSLVDMIKASGEAREREMFN